MTITRIFSVLLISILLFSCVSKKKEDEKLRPAEEIYNDSMTKLGKKQYKKAIEGFEELERTYPYSKWAIKAQIMSAYTSFQNEQYTDAVVTLDKFISLHPGNKDIEYAYYLKAICYYEQVSDVTRDQSYSLQARTALKEVVARFPESNYARDAQGKLDLIEDHLAGKEVEVGRFYLKQRKYIAAINRFKEVIAKYQTTSHVPEALHRLVEANIALGLKDEARKYAAVLGYNYPGSKWYGYSYRLIEGKKPDVLPEDSMLKNWMDTVKEPFKKLKGQKNLVNDVDKNVHELGETEHPVKVLPLKIQPVANDRAVKVAPEEPVALPQQNNGSTMEKIGNWFKTIKLPFSDKKDSPAPVSGGN